ncbi:hypothetical protein E2C01_002092 [Portunus trituberculatus]|uniref:Uncharacterized protein n=1 Tax=Portunus trituberculatus TaxID=210409 RepID=A0A5B7CJG9_PORTR|nr:hypothetical protein [Portunus trituberculatus]
MGLMGGCTWSILGMEVRGSVVEAAWSSRWAAGVQGMGLMRGKDPPMRVIERVGEGSWEAVQVCLLVLHEVQSCGPGQGGDVGLGSHGLGGDGAFPPGHSGSAVVQYCCVIPQTSYSV